MREYLIEDDGDSFQLALLVDGRQVGGCLLFDDGHGAGFELAREIGQAFTQGGALIDIAIENPILH